MRNSEAGGGNERGRHTEKNEQEGSVIRGWGRRPRRVAGTRSKRRGRAFASASPDFVESWWRWRWRRQRRDGVDRRLDVELGGERRAGTDREWDGDSRRSEVYYDLRTSGGRNLIEGRSIANELRVAAEDLADGVDAVWERTACLAARRRIPAGTEGERLHDRASRVHNLETPGPRGRLWAGLQRNLHRELARRCGRLS